MVDAALSTNLLVDTYNTPVPTKDVLDVTDEEADLDQRVNEEGSQGHAIKNDLTVAAELYARTVSCEATVEEVCLSDIVEKKKLEEKSLLTVQTSLLYLQYIEMLHILHPILKAERIGNCKLHLQSVYEMFLILQPLDTICM